MTSLVMAFLLMMAALLSAIVPAETATSSALGGLATWYDDGPGNYAAAGPDLRRWLGSGWRGDRVRVSANGRSVTVVLSDWCACGDRAGKPTIIDLSASSFRQLAPLSQGVLAVTVERAMGPSITLPPTSTEGG